MHELPRQARFDQIEGLRAWLAWGVVGWHLIQFTNLNHSYRILAHTAGMAALAVEIFIIISGFVITHLLVLRPEPYSLYLIRRAFRLFPLYAVAAGLGAVTTSLAAQAIAQVPWAGEQGWDFYRILLDTATSQHDHFVAHALLHLTLMQGLVPDSVLPFSSTVMLGPAWSLSLEWQFYLLAPLIVGALVRRDRAVPMVVLMLAGLLAYHAGLFGTYALTSVFPGAVLLFLTGIVSRLALNPLRSAIGSPAAVAIVALFLGLIAPALLSILIWIGFFAFMMTAGRVVQGVDRPLASLFRILFDTRPVRWLGARSYAVYVVHWPILETILFLLRRHLPASRAEAALLLAAGTVPTTLIVAELLHRLIEYPMMRRGAAAAAWYDARIRPPGARTERASSGIAHPA